MNLVNISSKLGSSLGGVGGFDAGILEIYWAFSTLMLPKRSWGESSPPSCEYYYIDFLEV